jgi:hypothetical protein
LPGASLVARIAGPLGLAALGLSTALAIAEIVLRLANVSFPIFDAYDEDRGLKLIPNADGIYDKEGRSHVRTNSLGYRDVEHERAKPPGVFRIAVLGDSFTEARQVEVEETYWKRLETILNASPQLGALAIEVLDFGIGGYGQAEELITLRKDVLRFSPDLVLLGFFGGNDLVNNHKQLSAEIRGDDFRPFYELHAGELVLDSSFHDASPSYFARRFLLTATHYLRTLEIVNQVRRNLWLHRMQSSSPSKELGVSESQYLPPQSEKWRQAWEITEALLTEMNSESSQAGASFAVVPIPSAGAVHPDPAARTGYAERLGVPDLLYPERRLTDMGHAHGFEVIEITQRLQDRATEKHLYLNGFENTAPGTGHWNREAHALAAELIAHDLLQLGIVAPEHRAVPSRGHGPA